jgi:hypothetical protein
MPEPAERGAEPSPFASLTSYPSNPYQATELPPRKTLIVEAVAGGVLGAVIGGAGCSLFGGGVLAVALGLLIGLAVGVAVGCLAGKLTGPTGTLTVGAVLWAMPRIVLVTLFLLFGGWLALLWVARADERDH